MAKSTLIIENLKIIIFNDRSKYSQELHRCREDLVDSDH